VGQINAAVTQLSQTTQQNASSSEELAATAEEMSSQAEQLQQAMSFFKIGNGAAPATRIKPKVFKQKKTLAVSTKRSGVGFNVGNGMAHGMAFAGAGPEVTDESQFARF
jgi:methyl-accepting chemotaxis protein